LAANPHLEQEGAAVSYPTVYGLLNVAGVNAHVSGRIYGFGEAPQSPTYPYITWEIVSEVPSNYLGEVPVVDNHRVEVNIWARDQQAALDTKDAVRTALDPNGHQILGLGPNVDPETQSYRIQFDYSLWTSR
jgi:hypothetical protein